MDPVVGSAINSDIIGSNSNSTGCLINLCSLCNLQFSESIERGNPNSAKVEKILSIFLSDNDEHGQVQLCFDCKMLCTNLLSTKHSLLFIIDKIMTLLLQNSRFTLVNPKYKIIPKLFQFRFTKTSPISQPRASFLSSSAVCDTTTVPGSNVLESVELAQSQTSADFGTIYLGSDKSVENTNGGSTSPTGITIDSNPRPNTLIIASGTAQEAEGAQGQVNNLTPSSQSSEVISLSGIEPSLTTAPLPANYELTTTPNGCVQKEDDLLAQLGAFSFPMDTALEESINILGSEALMDHVELGKSSPSYICEICGKSYLRKKRLDAHIRSHKEETIETKFQCSICHKTFTQKCGLQRHLLVHTGELPFQCTQCDRRFRHHSSLSIHKLTHNGKKQFLCHSCDTSFMSTSHLRRHQKSHTGFKPFSCKICPRTFSEKYNLESHVRTHTGETAFKCPHCAQGFNRKKKLKHHLTCDHGTS